MSPNEESFVRKLVNAVAVTTNHVAKDHATVEQAAELRSALASLEAAFEIVEPETAANAAKD